MISEPSFAMKLTAWMLMLRGSELRGKGFVRWSRQVEKRAYPAPAPIPRGFRKAYDIQTQTVQAQVVYTLAPRQRRADSHIIYTHGGAYVNPLQSIHWGIIQQLLEQVGASVTVPTYPLAPEYTYQPAFELLETVYRSVRQVHAGKKIILCGDSAGGGLALAQAIRYRELGLSLPDRVVLFSPWLDITMSNPHLAQAAANDKILGVPGLVQCGQWWAGAENPCNPLLSPIYGDLAGLPGIDIFQGTADLFIADARKLKEKAFAAGGAVNLYEYPGAFHVFMAATFTPEARDVFLRIRRLQET